MKRTLFFVATALCGIAMQTEAQTVKQTNITPITNGLSTINKLTPVTYSYDEVWAEKLKLKTTPINGFEVDETKNVDSKLVFNKQLTYTAGKNSTKTATVPSIDYEAIIPILVASIKEQQLQIDALKAELNKQKRSR